MKASQNALARILILSSGVLAAGCVPSPDSTPTPAPTPVQTAPAPAPTPVAAAPAPENWIDAPRTPGSWTYTSDASGSRASYGAGEAQFSLRCDRQKAQISLIRPRLTAPDSQLIIRTESANRAFATSSPTPQEAGPSARVVRISPRDPILDAMAITRGRFAVESEGLPSLYLPPWAEVTRVIEDCR